MPRRDLESLTPYAHAVDVTTLRPHARLGRVLRMGSNENPLGPPPKAVAAMERAAAEAGRYPQADNSRCIRAIAEHVDLDPRHIVVGNGGDECIDLLLRVQASPGPDTADTVLACRPCFDVYRTQTVLCGLRFKQIALKPDFSLPLRELARQAQNSEDHVAAVFVTSPDNPSGLATPREFLLDLARALPKGTFLLVDEAYVDFCDAPEKATCLPFVPELPNLGVLGTFSKAHGLAGARLGYMALPPELADLARRAQIPFSVNLFAQAGGLAALEDKEHYKRTLDTIRQGRTFLLRELRGLNCEVPQSQANFVMFRPPCDARELFAELLRQGILIRDLAPNGLPGWLRVSVGLEEECVAFVKGVAQGLAACGKA